MRFFKNSILAILGLFLLWVALNHLPLNELWQTLKKANYWLVIPVFFITLFGYYVRIKRWQLLYRHLQLEVSFKSAWIALCAGYLVSYALPRAGEITRCFIVKRYHQTPFNQSLASVIIERLTDTFVLFLLVAGISVLNIQQMSQFFEQNILTPIYNKFTPLILAALGLGILIAFVVLGLYWFYKKKNQASGWFDEFLYSIKQLFTLHEKLAYLFYTVLIWCCYFLMTYIWIFAFDDSAQLPASQVFVIMIIGTIGKSVPIQGGGMGAYHYLVAQAFLLFGVSALTGNALAIIIHGAQTVYTFLTGATAYGLLMYDEKTRNL